MGGHFVYNLFIRWAPLTKKSAFLSLDQRKVLTRILIKGKTAAALRKKYKDAYDLGHLDGLLNGTLSPDDHGTLINRFILEADEELAQELDWLLQDYDRHLFNATRKKAEHQVEPPVRSGGLTATKASLEQVLADVQALHGADAGSKHRFNLPNVREILPLYGMNLASLDLPRPFPFLNSAYEGFKSVGDYKFPGFIYMLVPIIKIFGTSMFAVRFLPALLGSLATFIIYLTAKELTKNKQVALLSAFLLSISPWHLQFTRAGADIGVSTFFVLLGVYLTLLGIKSKRLNLKPAALSFSIAIYTYFTDRIFTPLFLLSAFSIFPFKILTKKTLFRDLLFFFVLLLPALYLTFGAGQNEKFLKTTVFGLTRPDEYIEQLAENDSSFEINIFHNDLYEKVMGIADHYITHISPKFLILSGANFDLRQMIFGMGVMYMHELPFLIIGVL